MYTRQAAVGSRGTSRRRICLPRLI
ncbi:unnamed protein product [Ectocarpus sp. CCAP 1310/34]|nr:unnamed protein product [Ectocarpus sp. CCAP 1310/34]